MNSLKKRSSTVARYLSQKVWNRKRLMMDVLPTPLPPSNTMRTLHESPAMHSQARLLMLLPTLLLVCRRWLLSYSLLLLSLSLLLLQTRGRE